MEKTRSSAILNQSGFLAAQSLIGAAIVSATAVVLLGILSNLSQLSGKYIIKEQLTGASRAVQAVLMQEDACSNALRESGGARIQYDNSGPVTVDEVWSADAAGTGGQRILQANQPYQPVDVAGSISRISIGAIRLRPVAPNTPPTPEVVYLPGSPPTPVTYNTFMARLEFESSPGPTYNASPNVALPRQSVALKVLVDPANGRIARCYSLANDTQTCRAFNGSVTNGVCILPACGPGTPGVAPCPTIDPRLTCTGATGAASSLPSGTTQVWVWVFTNDPPQSATSPRGMKCLCIQSCG